MMLSGGYCPDPHPSDSNMLSTNLPLRMCVSGVGQAVCMPACDPDRGSRSGLDGREKPEGRPPLDGNFTTAGHRALALRSVLPRSHGKNPGHTSGCHGGFLARAPLKRPVRIHANQLENSKAYDRCICYKGVDCIRSLSASV